MVIENTGPEHKAHIKETWKRIIEDLAVKGLTDQDIENLANEIEIDDNEIRGWIFEVKLKGKKSLTYTLKNKDGAELLCDGKPLAKLGEA